MTRLTALALTALTISGCSSTPDHDSAPVTAPSRLAPAASAPATVFASPSGYFATSSCENPNELVVETPSVATSLITCFGEVARPPVRVALHVGEALRIVGGVEGPASLAEGQIVLRAAGTTLLAINPGTTTVATSGQRCVPGSDPCPLLTVVVTAAR